MEKAESEKGRVRKKQRRKKQEYIQGATQKGGELRAARSKGSTERRGSREDRRKIEGEGEEDEYA